METGATPEQLEAPGWLRFVFGKNPAWTIVRILFVVAATLIVFKFVLIPIRVTGDSMLPTYRDGQIKFVNRLAYVNSSPQRGDVVAAVYKEGARREILLLKRVIGMPGEIFQVENGEVLINGEPLEEPYSIGTISITVKIRGVRGKHERPGYSPPIPLGRNEYMVIGDNRNISEGYIREEGEILGKVL